MKVNLKIEKNGSLLYERVHQISDAESFGKACSDAWMQLHNQHMARATSIGALYEELNDQLLGEFDGALLRLTKA